MAGDRWMIEQWMIERKYRERTISLMDEFRDASRVGTGELTLDQIETVEAAAKSTVWLLRENKTNCVRHEDRLLVAGDSRLDILDGDGFGEVKREIDAAIHEVLETKAMFSVARRQLVSPEPVAVIDAQRSDSIDLADRILALAELHKLGILTEDEFSKAKGLLL